MPIRFGKSGKSHKSLLDIRESYRKQKEYEERALQSYYSKHPALDPDPSSWQKKRPLVASDAVAPEQTARSPKRSKQKARRDQGSLHTSGVSSVGTKDSATPSDDVRLDASMATKRDAHPVTSVSRAPDYSKLDSSSTGGPNAKKPKKPLQCKTLPGSSTSRDAYAPPSRVDMPAAPTGLGTEGPQMSSPVHPGISTNRQPVSPMRWKSPPASPFKSPVPGPTHVPPMVFPEDVVEANAWNPEVSSALQALLLATGIRVADPYGFDDWIRLVRKEVWDGVKNSDSKDEYQKLTDFANLLKICIVIDLVFEEKPDAFWEETTQHILGSEFKTTVFLRFHASNPTEDGNYSAMIRPSQPTIVLTFADVKRMLPRFGGFWVFWLESAFAPGTRIADVNELIGPSFPEVFDDWRYDAWHPGVWMIVSQLHKASAPARSMPLRSSRSRDKIPVEESTEDFSPDSMSFSEDDAPPVVKSVVQKRPINASKAINKPLLPNKTQPVLVEPVRKKVPQLAAPPSPIRVPDDPVADDSVVYADESGLGDLTFEVTTSSSSRVSKEPLVVSSSLLDTTTASKTTSSSTSQPYIDVSMIDGSTSGRMAPAPPILEDANLDAVQHWMSQMRKHITTYGCFHFKVARLIEKTIFAVIEDLWNFVLKRSDPLDRPEGTMAEFAVAIQDTPPEFFNNLGIMVPHIYNKELLFRSNEITIECPAPTAAVPNPIYTYLKDVRHKAELNFIPPKLQLKAIHRGLKKNWLELYNLGDKYLSKLDSATPVTDQTVRNFFTYLIQNRVITPATAVAPIPSTKSTAKLSAISTGRDTQVNPAKDHRRKKRKPRSQRTGKKNDHSSTPTPSDSATPAP